MFNEPRVNVIACDEGFSVEVLGHIGLTYTEGPRRMFIDSELLAGPRYSCLCQSKVALGAATRQRTAQHGPLVTHSRKRAACFPLVWLRHFDPLAKLRRAGNNV